VLDEPVAGVDAASQRQFVEVLAHLAAQGITIVVVLHEIGDFASLITRAIVLRHGKIVADGAPDFNAAPGHDHPEHVHQHTHDSSKSVLVNQIAEHESGFNELSPQIGLTFKHHGTEH